MSPFWLSLSSASSFLFLSSLLSPSDFLSPSFLSEPSSFLSLSDVPSSLDASVSPVWDAFVSVSAAAVSVCRVSSSGFVSGWLVSVSVAGVSLWLVSGWLVSEAPSANSMHKPPVLYSSAYSPPASCSLIYINICFSFILPFFYNVNTFYPWHYNF